MWMEEKVGKRINLERVDEALGTGAETVITGCPFCTIMLDDGITTRRSDGAAAAMSETTEVMDVARMLLASVKGTTQ
jgi:Fe-S oxidoreductase